MDEDSKPQELLSLTTEIVASFAGNNTLAVSDLPGLISSVFHALRAAGQGEAEKTAEALTPAVPVRKSVRPDFLICLEDGKKLKMLKRHLASRYNMTLEDYRRRWGLPKDYPMVAPAYSAQRSTLAMKIGLGRKPAAPASVPTPDPAANVAPRRAGGRRKTT
jgi:MucR family transcriptional regulator, transcriptional regulator of exopolysaccharide biosynthesis